MRPIEDDELGDLLTWEEFVGGVECHGFTDYDGFGEYATDTRVSNKTIKPSDIAKGNILHGFSHVLWYNR